MRNPALRIGDSNVLAEFVKTNADQFILAWRRKLLEREVLVFLNLSSLVHDLIVEEQSISGIYTNIFDATTIDLSRLGSIKLQPWDTLVFEK